MPRLPSVREVTPLFTRLGFVFDGPECTTIAGCPVANSTRGGSASSAVAAISAPVWLRTPHNVSFVIKRLGLHLALSSSAAYRAVVSGGSVSVRVARCRLVDELPFWAFLDTEIAEEISQMQMVTVDHDPLRALIALADACPEPFEGFARSIPLHPVGVPSDVNISVTFGLSDRAKFAIDELEKSDDLYFSLQAYLIGRVRKDAT